MALVSCAPVPKPEPGLGKALLVGAGVGLGAFGTYAAVNSIVSHHRAHEANEAIANMSAQQNAAAVARLNTPTAPIQSGIPSQFGPASI